MATDYQAISYADVVPMSKARSFRWSRVLPLALLVPIVLAFGTPVLAFALLAAVLAMPILVTAIIVLAARHERSSA
jgi:hypothetical protein